MGLSDPGNFSRSHSTRKYFMNNYKASETIFFLYYYLIYFSWIINWSLLKETILLFQTCSCISLWVCFMVKWKKLYQGGLFVGFFWQISSEMSCSSRPQYNNWIIAFFFFLSKIYSVQTMNMVVTICTSWSLFGLYF